MMMVVVGRIFIVAHKAQIDYRANRKECKRSSSMAVCWLPAIDEQSPGGRTVHWLRTWDTLEDSQQWQRRRVLKEQAFPIVTRIIIIMTDIIIIIQVYVQTTLEDGVLLERYCRRVVWKEVVVFIIIIIIVIKTNKQSS